MLSFNHKEFTTLGNYNVQRKYIGKGSFSKIYKGYNVNTKDTVAVKIIKKKNIIDEKLILREISVMKIMNHINILKLKDVLNSNNKYYLILEFCDNGNLKEYMTDKILNEEQLYYYMNQIKDGIGELYKHNIIHRDLKPQNILVSNNKILKISDFGFAKSYIKEELSNTMCGSPLYMAPEILKYESYSEKADLWSIGVIMYELIYKKTPVNGTNIMNLMENLKTFEYKFENTMKISKECVDLLSNLLQKNQKKRIMIQEFLENNWFKKNIYNQELFIENTKLTENSYMNYCNMIKSCDLSNGSNENSEYIFSMEEDDYNLTKTTNTTICSQYFNKNDYSSDDEDYVDKESDNFIVISSQSKFIQNIPKRSVADRNIAGITKIYNSLKDSLSFMFSPNSL